MKRLIPFIAGSSLAVFKLFYLTSIASLFFLTSCTMAQQGHVAALPGASIERGVLKDYYVMIVRESVADFQRWKKDYDAASADRLKAGMHNYSISRNPLDTNLIQITMRITDTVKAKQFFKAPGRTTMWLKTETEHASTDTTKLRVMITHAVKDRVIWRKIFEQYRQTRINKGLKDRAIDFHPGDTSLVTVVYAVTDKSKAYGFMESEEFKMQMSEEGVVSKPEIFVYTVVHRY